MSENTIRHIIALCGTLVAILAWFSGYLSGANGWWWTILSTIIIYVAIYTLVDA